MLGCRGYGKFPRAQKLSCICKPQARDVFHRRHTIAAAKESAQIGNADTAKCCKLFNGYFFKSVMIADIVNGRKNERFIFAAVIAFVIFFFLAAKESDTGLKKPRLYSRVPYLPMSFPPLQTVLLSLQGF